ncbi:MAG: PadR family transcriptional regulator [Candidatus Omnitrophica bacterium]|nr:PadR family transcriptional regulator [Candidatus Omnitrophota bacterium]MDD5771368.1 PadR family transcriptional regulator [Candidatus Omnitrophota bacterium]
MIEQEFLLLGLLRQSPKHGYEIKVKIRQILSLFAGVDLKSIYYPLRILERKGLLDKHTGKEGKRPERFVYCLTKKGKERFDELLNKSLLDFKRPQFSLDLSLYFLDYLKPSLSRRRLAARLMILKKISSSIEEALQSSKIRKSVSLSRILKHNLCLLRAESDFLSSLIKEIQS